MGMFDYVRHTEACPTCGDCLGSFQSKDSWCTMDTLDYWEVDEFYNHCLKCHTHVRYSRTPPQRPRLDISDYSTRTRALHDYSQIRLLKIITIKP